ncbi:MAG: glycosyltransferase family 2 protein [Sphingomonas oligoaromativorans]|jgi:GT2 family glycosyltransferase
MPVPSTIVPLMAEADYRRTVGAVVIGRNEGTRLERCLDSVARDVATIVYVDSGSSDDSVTMARERGIEVVELEPCGGFTAARARNAGFARLAEICPDLAFVQFVDGDCELRRNWLALGLGELQRLPKAAAVCGRRRERHPDNSPYNRLCDLEWDTPVGIAATCGGDALMRVEAFREVGGFTARLIAGEEPDLCHRMRATGWTIHRLPYEMTIHDAGMTRIAQWWQRNRRSGYATAEALALRGWSEPRTLREVLSNIFWASPLGWPLWPLLWWKTRRHRGALYATFVMMGKIPHLQGQFDYWMRRRQIIEYK